MMDFSCESKFMHLNLDEALDLFEMLIENYLNKIILSKNSRNSGPKWSRIYEMKVLKCTHFNKRS